VADRYKLAMGRGKKEFEQAVEEDKQLLGSFGLGLLSVRNGLRVVLKKSVRGDRINPWDVIEVNARLWGWLRPLLLELYTLRQAARKPTNKHKVNRLNGGGAICVDCASHSRGASAFGSSSAGTPGRG
jgi:hypothetical protein